MAGSPPVISPHLETGDEKFTTIDPGSSKSICGSSDIRMNSGPKAWQKKQQKR